MAESEMWQVEVERLIKEAAGNSARVDFFYPEVWNETPAVITYRLAGKKDLRADDQCYASLVTIYVDIWSREPALVEDLSARCKAALEDADWIYDNFSNDLFEQGSGWYHRTERYRQD